jgi:hypothetical protein
MRDILTENQTALWVDLVHEAEHDAAAPLGEELESYLVFLLIAHMRDTHLHRDAIAIDFLLAKTQAGQRHRDELRKVGDRCLLLAGLYPEQARRRMVGLDYFISMGSQAYHELAHALRAAVGEIYEHLAERFARVVRVLLEVRRRTRDVAPLMLFDTSTRAGACEDPRFPGALLLGASSTRQ